MWIPEKNGNCQWKKSDQQTSKSRTQEAECLTLPKSARLLKRQEYKQVVSEKNRFIGQNLVIDYRVGFASSPKIGITTSRSFGKAVQRNRFKRLVREAFRLNQHQIFPSVEMAILPKKGVTSYTLSEITSDFLTFSQKWTTNESTQCSTKKSS